MRPLRRAVHSYGFTPKPGGSATTVFLHEDSPSSLGRATVADAAQATGMTRNDEETSIKLVAWMAVSAAVALLISRFC